MLSPEDETPNPGLGTALAALLFGLVGLLGSPLLLGLVLAPAALVLAVLHRRRGGAHGTMALWGGGLGVLGLLASLGLGAFYYHAYRQYQEYAGGGPTSGSGGGDDRYAELAGWHGVAAPATVFHTVDGKRVDLASLKGRRVVVNVWATWCAACVREIPHFDQLAKETPQGDLVILGLSQEDRDTVKSYGDENHLSYALIADDSLGAPFGTPPALPTTFFIDRNGVIQSTHVGYMELDELKAQALGPDFAGAPQATRREEPGLTPADAPRTPRAVWTLPLEGAVSVTTCDLDGDGAAEALVGISPGALRVVDAQGRVSASFKLDRPAGLFDCGFDRPGGGRILGYDVWGDVVTVLDGQGRGLWSLPSTSGVNGAHFGDLDGDGRLEVVVGMNGDGGLRAVSSEGRPLWHDTSIGNVWTQAVLSSRGAEAGRVFATEAGGSVRAYDGSGKKIATLKPLERYYAPLSAARIDGQAQLVAEGAGRATAFDEAGHVAWESPIHAPRGRSWRAPLFAHGDLDGDGREDWVFAESSSSLAVASAAGRRLATLARRPDQAGFAVLPARQGRGLLLTLSGTSLEAFALD